MTKESLHSVAVSRFRTSENGPYLSNGDRLSDRNKDLYFAMQCNGWFFLNNGDWTHSTEAASLFINSFNGQRIAFSGPNANDKFFSGTSGADAGPERLIPAFDQDAVADVIHKYRKIDEDQAARIAFIFGGLVRYLSRGTMDCEENRDRVEKTLRFVAEMTKLGGNQSGEAVASALTMYVVSGGTMKSDVNFARDIYYMAEAVGDHPIKPRSTKDLGLSQVLRLRAYAGKTKLTEEPSLPDLGDLESAFDGFPTVGAEFHFPIDSVRKHPKFLQRLALLNISQYDRGSYIQFSRNDRGVFEVRMNPSIYPVTIANWQFMKLLLPELNHAFFTITLNHENPNVDFDWITHEDLLNGLVKVGLLTYAGGFSEFVRAHESEEINFGSRYLGQTVKLRDGEYQFTGNWGGGLGDYGQFGLYVGYGDSLPELAYYMSMVLADPNLLRKANLPRKLRSLSEALDIPTSDGKGHFVRINNLISGNERLRRASDAGIELLELLGL